MTPDPSSRIDRLEALAETTLLAIRELSNQQKATQQQLDQVAVQQALNAEQIAANAEQIAANTVGMTQLRHQLAAQQALNAEQNAVQQAGLIQLQNAVANIVHAQR